jgi:serine/threonine protein kinase/Tol biopolymer transport system component
MEYFASAAARDQLATIRTHVESCSRCRAVAAAFGDTTTTSDARAPGLAESDELRGMTVGRYTVLEHVGRGAMGVVYAARDPDLDRKVALKLIRADHGAPDGEASRSRLLREAQAMARLSHPNVITVYVVGSHESEVFIAMELVSGGTLSEWLRAAPRSWREIVRAFREAGEGLSAAHTAGLVHRDFKPDNVLVRGDGRFCVGDFGLARASGDGSDGALDATTPPRPLDQRLTRSDAVVGTPAYMAPEQARGNAADARSDQFSFCVALYEALFGVRPFAGLTLLERLIAITAGPASPPRRTRVPRHILRALNRGLAADPDARFPTMAALLVALAPRRRALAWLAVPVAALVAIATSALVRTHHATPGQQAVVHSVRRLTFTPDCAGMPSFTPDGKTVVYQQDGEDGAFDVHALDLVSGTSRKLTAGPGSNWLPALSPDGRYLAYVHDDLSRQLRVQPLDGSEAPRTLAPMPSAGAALWLSPTMAAAFDADGDIAGWSVNEATPRPHLVRLPTEHKLFQAVAPFPDGGLALNWQEDEEHLGIGVLEKSELRLLALHVPYVKGGLLAAPSGQAVYFPRLNGAVAELVRVPRNGGEPQAIGGGVAPWFGAAISADGSKLVFSTCRYYKHLVAVDDDGRGVPFVPFGDWEDLVAMPLDQHRFLLESNRSGSGQIYLFNADTKELRSLVPKGGLTGISRDRRWFVHMMITPPGIWLRSVDGSRPPRRLTDDGSDTDATFTHDDRHVIFTRGKGYDRRLWIVPVAGGAARQLVAMPARESMPSAADKRIFFVTRTPTEWRIMITDEEGATPLPAPLPPRKRSDVREFGFTRSRDGQRILVVRGGHEIIELDVDGKRPPRVRYKTGRWIAWVTYAEDDEHLIASLSFGQGDLWLAEGRFP